MTIAELFDRHYDKVHAFLRALSGSRTLADDLAQETFLRLLKLRISDGRMEERYLMRVAYTCWARHLRTKKTTLHLDDVAIPATFSLSHEAAEEAETSDALRRCWSRMSSEHRAILLLVSCLGYTFVEASEILGIPRTTLVSRHRSALEWMKANFMKDK